MKWLKLTTSRAVVFVSVVSFSFFMEWLFQVTKPSYMQSLSYFHSLATVVGAILLVTIAVLPVIIVMTIFRLSSRTSWVESLPSALAAGITLLLMTDNFTYTVFGLGIKHSGIFFRIIYIAGFVVVSTLLVYRLKRFHPPRSQSCAVALLLIISAGILLYNPAHPLKGSETAGTGTRSLKRLPNILFFASDGVEASRLRQYGYARNLTPHLDSLGGDKRLLIENAFSVAAKTAASVMAMLTGRHPLTTRVFHTLNYLKGPDAYKHLPGILRAHGYSTFQEGLEYFVDSPSQNMRDAFSIANGRKWFGFQFLGLPPWLEGEEIFLSKSWERVRERIFHILGLEEIRPNFELLTKARKEAAPTFASLTDEKRIDNAISYISDIAGPFFLHIHLLDSHCRESLNICRYYPKERVFSQGMSSPEDRYDDVIAESDIQFGRLVDWLRENGRFDNTLIVYSSDHGRLWDTTVRVPLLFFFPDEEFSGRRTGNASLLDVAPTVLDYLGVEIPPYMEGRSLLMPVTGRNRIFSMTRGALAYIECDRWAKLDNRGIRVEKGVVPFHTRPCDQKAPTDEQIREIIRERRAGEGG